MESLRGIFPQAQPPPKRDFLKENVMRIRNIQRMRKPPKESEYSNKFNQPLKPRKLSLCEGNARSTHRSMHSLALCSTKAPLNNLRKSVSSMSIQCHKECGTQTVDTTDDFFLKDSIIRYPSASTLRSTSATRPLSAQQSCSRGHQMEPEEPHRPRFKSNFHERKDEHSDKVERHISNLSEFLERGTISKKQPSSILKSSSTTSTQKSNKNYINEHQRKENRHHDHDGHKIQTVVLSDEDDDDVQKEKRSTAEKHLNDAKKAQLQAAEDDPNCPEGHVPLPESERLEALKLAQKRKSASSFMSKPYSQTKIFNFRLQALSRRSQPPADDERNASRTKP